MLSVFNRFNGLSNFVLFYLVITIRTDKWRPIFRYRKTAATFASGIIGNERFRVLRVQYFFSANTAVQIHFIPNFPIVPIKCRAAFRAFYVVGVEHYSNSSVILFHAFSGLAIFMFRGYCFPSFFILFCPVIQPRGKPTCCLSFFALL